MTFAAVVRPALRGAGVLSRDAALLSPAVRRRPEALVGVALPLALAATLVGAIPTSTRASGDDLREALLLILTLAATFAATVRASDALGRRPETSAARV